MLQNRLAHHRIQFDLNSFIAFAKNSKKKIDNLIFLAILEFLLNIELQLEF